jgi:membrane protease YdiL (CAAX protease family)
MMPLSIFDHVLIAALFVALPIEGVYAIRQLLEQIKAGDPSARSKAYVKTITLQWALFAALVIAWLVCRRPWPDLGFRFGNSIGAAIGTAFLILVGVFVRMQHTAVRKMTDQQVAKFQERSSETAFFLPSTHRERVLFAMTAATAGICEELLCRGFVFWYLGHFMNPWLSLPVASAAFGLAHAYQGGKGIVRTGIVGAIFGALFVLTHSLLYPIIGHITIDMAALGIAKRLATPTPTPDRTDRGDSKIGAATPAK